MANPIHYKTCPACDSAAIVPALSVKDHSVSGETFFVLECISCTLRFTQDVPDAASISPYYKSEDYISHTNTSRGLVNRLYQWVRTRTMNSKRKMVAKYTGLEKGQLLDLGSGTGTFAYNMKKNGWTVTALEPDEQARGVARQTYQMELQDIDGFYELTPGQFDAITLWHVLEHVHDLHGYLQKLKSLLNENGKLFIAVPNYTSADAEKYQDFWAAYDVPRHLYHFSPRSLVSLVEKNGMKVVDYRPMWFDSFYICLLSSKYKHGKPILTEAFWNGLLSNGKALGDVKKCSSVVYIVRK